MGIVMQRTTEMIFGMMFGAIVMGSTIFGGVAEATQVPEPVDRPDCRNRQASLELEHALATQDQRTIDWLLASKVCSQLNAEDALEANRQDIMTRNGRTSLSSRNSLTTH